MECQFCKNVFSTKTSLNNHQKTAKYCLKLRDVKSETSYKCDGCGKTFSRSYHLQRHQKQCKSNDIVFDLESKLAQAEKDIEMYKKDILQKTIVIQEKNNQIEKLQDKLENIEINEAILRVSTNNNT